MKYFGERDVDQEPLGDEFYSKVLPTLFIGAIIWALTTLFFSGYITGTPIPTSLRFIIFLSIGYFGIWIVTMVFSARGQNETARGLFFIAAFFTGILNSYILTFAALEVGLQIARDLFAVASIVGVCATGTALAIGYMQRSKIKGNYFYSFLAFGLVAVVMEWILSIFFYNNNTVMILISLGMLIWIFGVIVYDGATLPYKIAAGLWMMAVIDIFLDFVIVIIRIFVILVRIFAEAK